MAAPTGLLAPASMNRSDVPAFPPVALSAEAAPFTPLGPDGWRLGSPSDVEKQFSRCAAKLRALRADSGQLREELNLLFDQLLSENYNRTFDPNINIRPEVTHTRCGLLVSTEHKTTNYWKLKKSGCVVKIQVASVFLSESIILSESEILYQAVLPSNRPVSHFHVIHPSNHLATTENCTTLAIALNTLATTITS